jgi:hypothetical protein
MMFTNRQKANEAFREVSYRKFVYSRQVEAGKMTEAAAKRKIAIMEEIGAEYAVAADKDEEAGRLL